MVNRDELLEKRNKVASLLPEGKREKWLAIEAEIEETYKLLADDNLSEEDVKRYNSKMIELQNRSAEIHGLPPVDLSKPEVRRGLSISKKISLYASCIFLLFVTVTILIGKA